MKKRNALMLLGLVSLGLSACAPKVYVIDRATILEEESGGEWPSIDEAQRRKLLKTSPSAQRTSNLKGQQEKLTRILEPDESVISTQPSTQR